MMIIADQVPKSCHSNLDCIVDLKKKERPFCNYISILLWISYFLTFESTTPLKIYFRQYMQLFGFHIARGIYGCKLINYQLIRDTLKVSSYVLFFIMQSQINETFFMEKKTLTNWTFLKNKMNIINYNFTTVKVLKIDVILNQSNRWQVCYHNFSLRQFSHWEDIIHVPIDAEWCHCR